LREKLIKTEWLTAIEAARNLMKGESIGGWSAKKADCSRTRADRRGDPPELDRWLGAEKSARMF